MVHFREAFQRIDHLIDFMRGLVNQPQLMQQFRVVNVLLQVGALAADDLVGVTEIMSQGTINFCKVCRLAWRR